MLDAGPFRLRPFKLSDFIKRQRGRAADGTGYSFAIAASGRAVGQVGLWVREAHDWQEIGGERRDLCLYARLASDPVP